MDQPFELKVNGRVVWRSDVDAEHVEAVSLSSKKGEAGRIGVGNDIREVNVEILVRDQNASNYLDLQDLERRKEAQQKEAKPIPGGEFVTEEEEEEETPEEVSPDSEEEEEESTLEEVLEG